MNYSDGIPKPVDVVYRLMRDHGTSRQDLAEGTGIGVTTLWRRMRENPDRGFTRTQTIAIATFFAVPPESIDPTLRTEVAA